MKNKIKYLAASLSTSAIITPILAFAETPPGTLPQPGVFNSLTAFRTFICTIVFGWLFTFLIVLAAIFALVAAYKYLTAGGDPEKVKAASNILIYCAIAVVAALFARGLPTLIQSLIGGGSLTGMAC